MEFIKRHRRRLESFIYKDRVLISGSSSEIPAVYFFTKPTDLDFMMYRTDVCAVPKNAPPSSDFRGEVMTIDPDGLPAGYVRLKNFIQEYEKHLQTFEYDNLNGPAITSAIGWSSFTFDNVFSVQCPYWPPEAQEWQTRHRPHGWPSKDLIDQIVSEGCFLVGKSHPSCRDDDKTQWRYSFSKAEMRLISSWTDSQMYVYQVLRLIKSEIVTKYDDQKKTGLCTYHLKTQMFWACEEMPAEFWDDSNIVTCICELLTQMERRFTSRNFPNYFLRDFNLIEGNFIEDNYRVAIRMLNTEFGRSFLKSKLPPKVCHECRYFVSFPQGIALYWILFMERFGVPFQAHRPKLDKFKALIDEELDDLMNGIYNMQLAKTLGHSYYTVAEQHFWNSISRADRVSNKFEVKRVKLSNRISPNAITALYESLENAELSTSVQANHEWDISVVINCTKRQCPYSGMSRNFPWNEAHVNFCEKWLNPSHLISAAYLSNLYFTTGNFALSREIVGKKHNFAHSAFNSELFPMIFCPELASLFDENLQEVIGMLWLCKKLWGRKEIFEFCTCPQLFMLYIRIQSSFRLGDLDLVIGAVDSFNGHRDKCKFRYHLYSYHYVLLEMAWRICNDRYRKNTLASCFYDHQRRR